MATEPNQVGENPLAQDPDIAAYLDAFHAFDTVTEDLDSLAMLHSELAESESDADSLLDLDTMVEEEKISLLHRRNYVLQTFIGSSATKRSMDIAAGLYLDEFPELDEQGIRKAHVRHDAIERVRSYAALITLTQYKGAPPAGGSPFPKREASTVTQSRGRVVRMYGVPDDEGRGLWVNVTNPRSIDILSASQTAIAVLTGREIPPKNANPAKVVGTYDVLASYEHEDGSVTVTAVPESTDQTPFTVNVPSNSRSWRLSSRGTLLEVIIPDGASSISELDIDHEIFLPTGDEVAAVALRAAGGAQSNIIGEFDTTGRQFNPVAVPVGKRS